MRFDAAETATKLPYSELVPAIARAAREMATGIVNAPERLAVQVGTDATLLCMPAVGPDIGITKIVTVHPQNASRGVPVIQGEVVVFDVATGQRLMLLDGPTVTSRRTAAVTLLAIERLARQRPQSVLLIGTGVQAMAHAEALIDYFGVSSFRIAGIELQLATIFCEELCSKHPGIEATALASPDLAPTGLGTDVVIALTTSKVPIIPPQLPESTLAIGIGAFRPDMAEIPVELLRKRRVVVDYRKGAQLEAGDLLRADLDWDKVSELSQQLEASPERHLPAVFKSVGHASWDLAAARVAILRTE